ncbi:MAG: glycosyltransferase, partial [Actinomycetota bacterium]
QPSPADAPPRPDLHGADLVAALGGGWLTDVDPATTGRILDLLEAAADAGLPTVMFGQGIGPLDDPDLRRRAAEVLPRVDLIAVREPLAGQALLEGLGVSPDRIVLTGDDALELGRDEPPIPPGRAIGVTLRIASYAGVEDTVVPAIRRAVQGAAGRYGAPLVEFVISEFEDEDRRTTRLVTDGYPDVVREDRPSRSPAAILRRVAGCRVVVTGTYHIAVFALSRGIPVVCLSGSGYYDGKLLGLQALFPGGVEVLSLASPDLEGELGDAITRMWDAAPRLRRPLVASAARQIADQHAFSRRALSLVPGAHLAPQPAPAQDDGAGPPVALSVVIPCRNAAATLPRTVEMLAAQEWDREWEIVVADNGSTDDTAAVLARLCETMPRLRVVDASDRPGAAHARNVGAHEARGRAIAFFDADDVPHDGWVAAMGDALDTDAFVACRLETESLNGDWAQAVRGRPQWDGLLPTEHPPYLPAASGGTIGIRRDVFLDVGGFDETLPLAGEDIEFCWRVQLAGHPLRFVPEAVVSMVFRADLRSLFSPARRYGYGQPAV